MALVVLQLTAVASLLPSRHKTVLWNLLSTDYKVFMKPCLYIPFIFFQGVVSLLFIQPIPLPDSLVNRGGQVMATGE